MRPFVRMRVEELIECLEAQPPTAVVVVTVADPADPDLALDHDIERVTADYGIVHIGCTAPEEPEEPEEQDAEGS